MKNGKKRKKDMRRFWNRYNGLILAGLAVLAVFALFFREQLMELLWAVLLVVVPVAAAGLLIGFWGYQLEEVRRRQRRRNHGGHGAENADGARKAAPDAVPEQVAFWYESYGRARIAMLVSELEEEGIRFVWIRPDGVCNVSTQKGYRRRAVLSDYPERYADEVAWMLRRDHIAAARRDGKYICLRLDEKRRAA